MQASRYFNTVEQFRSAEGGFLLVDKPMNWTSFDVVKKVRGMFRIPKVGHAGTLDPLATGLLVLASQRKTKKIQLFQELQKTYIGDCMLGSTTLSYDAATEPENQTTVDHITITDIRNAAKVFTGRLEQVPPMFSAVKVAGERLYKSARRGETVERNSKVIEVTSFRIESVALPVVHFQVICSKGTYVRSLVHDLGQLLGCGAYLHNLRRTAIGAFRVDEAWTIEQLSTESTTPSSVTIETEE